MTLNEIIDWINSAERETSTVECDRGNVYDTVIYKKDGKLYSVEFCNGNITEKWGNKGYIRGEYEVTEVFKRDEHIVVTRYLNAEELNDFENS